MSGKIRFKENLGETAYESECELLMELGPSLIRCLTTQALHDLVLVNNEYDIPYLAGYSVDGQTIYMDRRLPNKLKIDGQNVEIQAYILFHERIEKLLIDLYHMDYQQAHKHATHWENSLVAMSGVSPRSYEQALLPYIRGAAHESVQRVPADLDLTPYVDENDKTLLRRIMRAN